VPGDFTVTPIGNTVTLNNFNSPKPSSISWGDGTADKSVNNPSSVTHTYNNNGTYTITAFEGWQGCTRTKEVTIAAPEATLLPAESNVSICPDEPAVVSFDMQITQGEQNVSAGYTCTWSITPQGSSPADGAELPDPESNVSSCDITFLKAGSYQVSCQADAGSVSLTRTAIVTVTQKATPSFSDPDISNLTVTFNDLQNVDKITWYEGGSEEDIATNTASYTYTTYGNYTIALSKTNGCTVTKDVTLTAPAPAPSLSIEKDNATTSICSDSSTTITYTANLTNATANSYSWSVTGEPINGFDVPTGSTTNSYTVTFTKAGNYTVSCTATTSSGDVQGSLETVINPLATPEFTISDASTGTVTVAETVSGTEIGITQVNWGDGVTNNEITHSYNASDSYNITVYYTNGCSKKEEAVEVTVPGPVASLSIDSEGNTSICSGSSTTVTYTATVTDATATSYSWSVTGEPSNGFDAPTDNTTNPYTVTFTKVGNYTVSCTANIPSGSLGKSTSTEITESTDDVPAFNICTDGLSVTLKELSNATTILWGDNNSDPATTVTHTYAAANTYNITVIGSSCDKTESVTVAVPTPTSCFVTTGNKSNEQYDATTGKLLRVKDNNTDNNWYSVVQIGTQCWMAENMRATNNTTLNNGTYDLDNSYRYNPGGQAGNTQIYGYLYNWKAASGLSKTTTSTPNGFIQGICPQGWHIPNDNEWNYMESIVNDSPISATTGCRGEHAGKLSKGCLWASSDIENAPGNDLNPRNTFGFSALPAGIFTQTNTFSDLGKKAYFWVAEISGYFAQTRVISNNQSCVTAVTNNKYKAVSVRCVRNESSPLSQ
jgi:uncharacterized protein (TIGR02145 family)